MSYLLDTNILSELIRQKPDERVVEWLKQIPNEKLYVSVLTLGEIRKGIQKLPQGQRYEKLRIWLDHEIPEWFEGRVLLIDQPVSDRWGRLCAQMERPLPIIDSLIAATALHHDLVLVTRNTKDFDYPSLEIVNPWIYDL